MGQKSNNGIAIDDLMSTEAIDILKELVDIYHEVGEHNSRDIAADVFLFAFEKTMKLHEVSI